jgi:acyl-CoA synthetase (AMP-forming)/AMP-acid ligase II
VIKAYVVLQSEARGKISEEEIMEFCRQNLAHYKVPKIIEFRGELPKTDVGKVSRRELREEQRGMIWLHPFSEIEGLQKNFGGLRAVNDVHFPWAGGSRRV